MSLCDVIYVYDGLGAKPSCTEHSLKCLRSWASGTNYKITTITPSEILEGGWHGRTALLAFGGGFDQGFLQTLGSKGQSLIREYVEEGGSYLGLCAGGYFGSSHIEFDKGGPLEVCGPREMKFYPGCCIGPVFPGFDYDSSRGSHAAKVNFKNQKESFTFQCFFDGGGKFVSENPFPNVEILGAYAEFPELPAAIVKCAVGKGMAILSGVHWEYKGSDLDKSDPYLERIIPAIEQSEEERLKCVDIIMNLLGLCKTSPELKTSHRQHP